jgi:hypothetical protein
MSLIKFNEFRAAVALVDADAIICHGTCWLYLCPDRAPTLAMYDRYVSVMEAFELGYTPGDHRLGFYVATEITNFTPWGKGPTSRWRGFGLPMRLKHARRQRDNIAALIAYEEELSKKGELSNPHKTERFYQLKTEAIALGVDPTPGGKA